MGQGKLPDIYLTEFLLGIGYCVAAFVSASRAAYRVAIFGLKQRRGRNIYKDVTPSTIGKCQAKLPRARHCGFQKRTQLQARNCRLS